jgi:glycosyltransferase involved in cell wall biosynthesis
MNILFLIESSEPGGAETVVLSLAKAFRDRGNNCVIGLLQTGWLNDRLVEAGFKPIVIRQNGSYDLACLWELISLIRIENIDVVHAHEFMMNTYGVAAGILTRTPVVTTVHGKNYYWAKHRRKMAYRLVSRLSRMVAVSQDLRGFLVDTVGISMRRIHTIYNGIELDGYGTNSTSVTAGFTREALSIPVESPVIGTAGMLVPVKDHSTLLKAAANVIRCYPSAVFLICGEGELRSQLEEEAQALGIGEKITFAGFRNDMINLLHIMDVYVCSSISEGLSLSVLEAMTAAKPVVATNVGGNPELVLNGETGFLVSPQDPESLASKITLLLNNKPLAHQFGLKGKLRADETFGREQMVASYERLYRIDQIRN